MKNCLLLAFALAFFQKTQAQTPCTALPQAHETMHVNDLRIPGILLGGYVGDYPEYENPVVVAGFDGAEKPVAGLSNSAIWLGGMDTSGVLHISAESYPNSSGFHFIPGPRESEDCEKWDRIWSVSRAALMATRLDLADGTLDEPLPEILGWPGAGNPFFKNLHGFDLPPGELAPFFDANADGAYNPFDGDFPHPERVDTALVPGKILWSIFHDPKTLIDPDVIGMGFEYRQTIWATACTDTSVLNDAVFFSLKIKNTSGQRMDLVRLALSNIFEIGGFPDDAFGTDTATNTVFGYNLQAEDLPESSNSLSYGYHPPAVAWTALDRSLVGTMYHQNDLCPGYPSMWPPYNSMGYWNSLHSRWKDGLPLLKEGTGYDPFNPTPDPSKITQFAFDGNVHDPDAWNAISAKVSCLQYATTNMIFSLGTLQPEQTETLDYVYSYHRDTTRDHLGNVDYLLNRVRTLHDFYKNQFKNVCTPPVFCQTDCVWPGDVNRDGVVNNCDFLPIGLKSGTTGERREGFVTWEPHTAKDWDEQFDPATDLKHLDCNGDGQLDVRDVRVALKFFGQTRPDFTPTPDDTPEGKEVYLRTNPTADANNIKSGQVVALIPMLETTDSVAAIAFTIEFDPAYFSNLFTSDLGTVLDFKESEMRVLQTFPAAFHFALTNKSNLPNGNLDKGFILKALPIQPGQPKLTFVKIKNLKALRLDGSEVSLGTWARQFCFGGGCTISTTASENEPSVRVFPNPAHDFLKIESKNEAPQRLEVFDLAGRKVLSATLPAGGMPSVDLRGLRPGQYVWRVSSEQGTAVGRFLKTTE